jgi:hypothetical protein
MEGIAALLGILAGLIALIWRACKALERLAEPPVTKRLDEHERAISGADPFGE